MITENQKKNRASVAIFFKTKELREQFINEGKANEIPVVDYSTVLSQAIDYATLDSVLNTAVQNDVFIIENTPNTIIPCVFLGVGLSNSRLIFFYDPGKTVDLGAISAVTGVMQKPEDISFVMNSLSEIDWDEWDSVKRVMAKITNKFNREE